MRAYGHAITLVLCALFLTAGAPVRAVLIPFLFIEAAAIVAHVDYEREQWRDG